jgi:hypothetical protein
MMPLRPSYFILRKALMPKTSPPAKNSAEIPAAMTLRRMLSGFPIADRSTISRRIPANGDHKANLANRTPHDFLYAIGSGGGLAGESAFGGGGSSMLRISHLRAAIDNP